MNIARKFIITAAALLAAVSLHAEGVLAHNFDGKYHGEAAQGMAIWKDTAFLFQNTGIVRVYNLKTDRFIRDFLLDTAAPENHANCAAFGVEFPEGVHSYPAIYISECYGQNRCFVQEINEGGARLLQTLRVKSGTIADKAFDWVVDREQKCLYTFALSAKGTSMKPEPQRVLITKFPLPSIKAGDVTFGKGDILDQFEIAFPNLTQGGIVKNGRLYLPVGLHDAPKGTKAFKSREILVVDLAEKKIVKRVDLNATVQNEPEDVDFHGDKLLLRTGQLGGLYEIKGL